MSSSVVDGALFVVVIVVEFEQDLDHCVEVAGHVEGGQCPGLAVVVVWIQ